MTIRRRLAAASALLLGLALTACATPTGGPPAPTIADAELDAAWLDAGRLIGVVTYGSSTCVPVAVDAEARGQTLTVVLQDPDAEACTADLAPRASVVVPPSTIDAAQDITIVVTGAVAGSTVLAGGEFEGKIGEPTDYAPSAGWFGANGFVVLTWGSSTCAPKVESVEAVSDDTLGLTFAEPPANQVCTMDMGPRTAVAAAPADFHQKGDVELRLRGAGIIGTTTILGEH